MENNSKKEPNKKKPISKEELIKKLRSALENIESEQNRVRMLLSAKEKMEINELSNLSITKNGVDYYPNILDPNFNIRLLKKKEFYDNRYDDEIKDLETEAKNLCERDFELAPHQAFIRNFLSHLTPYNGMLLYHGLGTGKTCSAISVCENMRDYMRQMGYIKPIIIVASPNVQKNFKSQLFNASKLTYANGRFTMKGCVGNKLIREAFPMEMKYFQMYMEDALQTQKRDGVNIDEAVERIKSKIEKQVKDIIKKYYVFMGYTMFSNFIESTYIKYETLSNPKERNAKIKQAIKEEFSNRLIVIDEVHNIRVQKEISSFGKKRIIKRNQMDENSEESNETKQVSKYNAKSIALNMAYVAQYAVNSKLLFMSATPMFDSHKEIIYIMNLLNINDGRPVIKKNEVFDSNGAYLKNEKGLEIGKERLLEKCRGYVSFIKGSNIYTFPYRVFPSEFLPERSIRSNEYTYPIIQINGSEITVPIQHIDLYLTYLTPYQELCYKHSTHKSDIKVNVNSDNDISVNLMVIDETLQILNMCYPNDAIIDYAKTLYGESFIQDHFDSHENRNSVAQQDSLRIDIIRKLEEKGISGMTDDFYGTKGLQSVMDSSTFKEDDIPGRKAQYKYKQSTLNKYGRIFSYNKIGNYSHKIKSILNAIKRSQGVVLLYSQYIEGGCVPLALALEEMGMNRYGQNENILQTDNITASEDIDANTLKTKTEFSKEYGNKQTFHPASYVMITGNKQLTPHVEKDLQACTDKNNKNGEKVKVIIISRAGSEGIDFKFIRQVHILDPWYNNNRNEQIIGRAIRYCSHSALPFNERNVEIYMHATQMIHTHREESMDLFMYRLAELKSIKIGVITRTLKEVAVDCLITAGNNQTTEEKVNKTIKLKLSSNGKEIDYKVGDKPYSEICDYMESCSYDCKPSLTKDTLAFLGTDNKTYEESHISFALDKYIDIAKTVFNTRFFITKKELITELTKDRDISMEKIHFVLDTLVNQPNEFVKDMFSRVGRVMNVGETYFFQPLEYYDTPVSRFDIVDKKTPKIKMINRKLVNDRKSDGNEEHFYNLVYYKYKHILYDNDNKDVNYKSILKKNWFLTHENINKIRPILNKLNFSEDKINTYILHHIFDTASYNEKQDIINGINNHVLKKTNDHTKIDVDFIQRVLKSHIEKEYIFENDIDDNKAYVLTNVNKLKKIFKNEILVLGNDKTFVEAEKLLQERITDTLNKKFRFTFPPKDSKSSSSSIKYLNNVVIGYMYPYTKEELNIFKLKDSERSKGYSCSFSDNHKLLEVFHKLIKIYPGIDENTKNVFINQIESFKKHKTQQRKDKEDGTTTTTKRKRDVLNDITYYTRFRLCLIIEFMIRYLDEIEFDNKKWFLTLEMAKLHNIEGIVKK